jgi:hypothetical protein
MSERRHALDGNVIGHPKCVFVYNNPIRLVSDTMRVLRLVTVVAFLFVPYGVTRAASIGCADPKATALYVEAE